MSSHTLLATISDMEARLVEMRQQLVQSMYVPSAPYSYSYPPLQQQSQPTQSQTHPPGFGPRPSAKGRVPYSMLPARAIPLQSHRPYSYPLASNGSNGSNGSNRSNASTPSRPSFQTVPLSAILQPQEEVHFRIFLRKGSQEEKGVLVTVFDGEAYLTVTGCELIPSLVGVSVDKPGVILYRFMEELHRAGHLKRTFTVAPWKLCYVVREGAEVTLEELRRRHVAGSSA